MATGAWPWFTGPCPWPVFTDAPQAVGAGRDYIIKAIASGASVRTGHGQGPVNHGHAPVAMHLLP